VGAPYFWLKIQSYREWCWKKKRYRQAEIQLAFTLPSHCFVEICLFDENGRFVYNFSDYLNPGEYDHAITTQHLPGGTYLLRIAKNGDTISHEIVELV